MININIETLKSIFPEQSVMSLANDFFVAEVTSRADPEKRMLYPFRFDGYLAIFCESGHMHLSIDMREYELQQNSFTVSLPKNILKLSVEDGYEEKIHFIAIALSKDWISRLNINTSELFSKGLSPIYVPTIQLTKKEINFTKEYYKIVVETLTAARRFMTNSLASLTASIFYEIAGAWLERMDVQESQPLEGSRNSLKIYNNFVALVTKYHVQERSVTFYADKLCISPKHLARVIKEVSGRTPTESIDKFVIMEAKNMLRYTNLSIKEITDQLHFSNQTIFYRFFKRNTGMHPTEFRKLAK